MRFYKTLEQDRKMTNVKGFLIVVARNLCISAKASKHYGLSSVEDLELISKDPDYEKKEILEIVRSSIECLPVELREPLVLKQYNCEELRNRDRDRERKEPCFRKLLPLTYEMPDDTEFIIETERDWVEFRQWYEENDTREEAKLLLPYTIVFPDGTEMIIESEEDLRLAWEYCEEIRENDDRAESQEWLITVTEPVNVDIINNDNHKRAYPNPAGDRIKFEFESNSSNGRITIISYKGTEVFQSVFDANVGVNDYELMLISFLSGHYYFIYETENNDPVIIPFTVKK